MLAKMFTFMTTRGLTAAHHSSCRSATAGYHGMAPCFGGLGSRAALQRQHCGPSAAGAIEAGL